MSEAKWGEEYIQTERREEVVQSRLSQQNKRSIPREEQPIAVGLYQKWKGVKSASRHGEERQHRVPEPVTLERSLAWGVEVAWDDVSETQQEEKGSP